MHHYPSRSKSQDLPEYLRQIGPAKEANPAPKFDKAYYTSLVIGIYLRVQKNLDAILFKGTDPKTVHNETAKYVDIQVSEFVTLLGEALRDSKQKVKPTLVPHLKNVYETKVKKNLGKPPYFEGKGLTPNVVKELQRNIGKILDRDITPPKQRATHAKI